MHFYLFSNIYPPWNYIFFLMQIFCWANYFCSTTHIHGWILWYVLVLHSSIKNIFFFRSFFPSRSRPPPKDVLNVWFEQTVSTAQTQTADTETTTNLENIFRKKNINHSLSPNTVAHSDIGCSHHLGLNNKYPNPPLLKL